MVKRFIIVFFCLLISFSILIGASVYAQPVGKETPVCPGPVFLADGPKRALEKRADQVVEMNDALVQRTIQAYGGNYIHEGGSKSLTLNDKTYKDFTIRVINNSQLLIETEDGVFQMDVINP